MPNAELYFRRSMDSESICVMTISGWWMFLLPSSIFSSDGISSVHHVTCSIRLSLSCDLAPPKGKDFLSANIVGLPSHETLGLILCIFPPCHISTGYLFRRSKFSWFPSMKRSGHGRYFSIQSSLHFSYGLSILNHSVPYTDSYVSPFFCFL